MKQVFIGHFGKGGWGAITVTARSMLVVQCKGFQNNFLNAISKNTGHRCFILVTVAWLLSVGYWIYYIQ